MSIIIFRNLLKKVESKIFLSCSLFPLLIAITSLFDTKLLQMNAPKGSLSFIEFFGSMISVQFQMVIPYIILIYLVISIFGNEIKTGKLYLYKDMYRNKILNLKLKAILMVYMTYIIILFITSLITYFLCLKNFFYVSGYFFANEMIYTQSAFFEVGSYVSLGIMLILLTMLISMFCSSGITMLGSIFFIMLSVILPHLHLGKYIVPNGYINQIETLGIVPAVLLASLVFLFSSFIIYTLSSKKFINIEF